MNILYFFRILHNHIPNKQITKKDIKNEMEIHGRIIIIVQKKVYDGTDCTNDLIKYHSTKAINLLKHFYIGDLVDK